MLKRSATVAAGLFFMAAAGLCQRFDVASLRPFQDDGVGPRDSHSTYGPQGIDVRGRTLAFLIAEAYHFQGGRIVGPGSLTRQPLWPALQQAYDIVAKADHPAPKDQLRLMLQTLLEERFQLKVHRETRILSVYKLVIGKGGPKLEESQEAGGNFSMSGGPANFVFHNSEMARLCALLSGQLDRVVVDQTGLEGIYNFTLQRAPEETPQAKSEAISPDSQSPASVTEALKLLGLQLIPGRAPVEYLVVDRVEKPSEN